MSALLPIVHRIPPRLYRTSRSLRRVAVIILVVLIVFLATSAYSAVRLITSSAHQSGGFSAGLASNETVEVNGSLAFSNPGFYPVQGFEITLRVLNATGVFLGESTDGPIVLPAGGSTVFPVTFTIPISGTSAAESLLVSDQPLTTDAWGNATFAFLFPVSVRVAQNQSWGAPFANLAISPGPPTGNVVPVTISFSNHANFPDVGALEVALDSSGGLRCANANYGINEPPGGVYSQTQDFTPGSGCSIQGGYALATYTTAIGSFVLPREALP